MAKLADIEDLKHQEWERYEAKLREFARKGKKPFQLKEHGPGVMPQHLYDALRDPNDPDYRPSEEGGTDYAK